MSSIKKVGEYTPASAIRSTFGDYTPYTSQHNTSRDVYRFKEEKARNWLNLYEETINGINKFTTERNGAWTSDVSGGYAGNIQKLLDTHNDVNYLLMSSFGYDENGNSKDTDGKLFRSAKADLLSSLLGTKDSIINSQNFYNQFSSQNMYDVARLQYLDPGAERQAAYRNLNAAYQSGNIDESEREQIEAQLNRYNRFDNMSDVNAIYKSKPGYKSQNWAERNTGDNIFERWLQDGKHMYSFGGASRTLSNAYGDDVGKGKLTSYEGLEAERLAAKNGWSALTDEEINMYFYIKSTKGDKIAEAWLTAMAPSLYSRMNDQLDQAAVDAYKESNPFMKMAYMPVMAMGAVAEGMLSAGKTALNTIAPNAFPDYIKYGGSDGINAVKAAAADEVGEGWRQVFKSFGASDSVAQSAYTTANNTYMAFMSGIESLIGMEVLGGIGEGAGLISGIKGAATTAGKAVAAGKWIAGNGYTWTMGFSAAVNQAKNLYEQGASIEQIKRGAALSGVAEALFEHLSLEAFNGLWLSNKASLGAMIKNLLIQSAVEGSEEVFTDWANQYIDYMNRGDMSDFQQRVRYYQQNGESREKAEELARRDERIESWWSFYGGFIASTGAVKLATNAATNVVADTVNGEAIIRNQNGDTMSAQNIEELNAARQAQEERNLAYVNSVNDVAASAEDFTAIRQIAENMGADFSSENLNGNQMQGPTRTNQDVIRNATGDNYGVLNTRNIRTQTAQNIANKTDFNSLSRFGQLKAYNKIGQAERQIIDKSYDISINDYRKAADEYYNQNKPEGISKRGFRRLVENYMLGHELSDGQTRKLNKLGGDSVIEQVASIAEGVEFAGSTETESTVYESTQNASDVAASVQSGYDNETAAHNYDSIDDYAGKFGSQANYVTAAYNLQDRKTDDVGKFASAYETVYNLGLTGQDMDVLQARYPNALADLSDGQIRAAYQHGVEDAGKKASERQENVDKSIERNQNRNKSWKHGTVKGVNVSTQELYSRFNDQQKKAYKFLTMAANVTGIDIYLFDSAVQDGKYQGEQGKFTWKDDAIYVDINAGLTDINDATDLYRYTMLRTFTHEFTHFIEKWNPVGYNELRSYVFKTLNGVKPGFSDHAISAYQANCEHELSYDDASREAVAEGLVDIFNDSQLLQNMATEKPTLFRKLVSKLKEFVQNIRDYFANVGNTNAIAKNLRVDQQQMNQYLEGLVAKFDSIAMQAVENYQKGRSGVKVNTEGETRSESKNQKHESQETQQDTQEEQTEEAEVEAPAETEQEAHEAENAEETAEEKPKEIVGSGSEIIVIPGTDTVIARIEKENKNWIDDVCEFHPEYTINDLKEHVYGYDKQVVQAIIDAGYGDTIASEFFHTSEQRSEQEIKAREYAKEKGYSLARNPRSYKVGSNQIDIKRKDGSYYYRIINDQNDWTYLRNDLMFGSIRDYLNNKDNFKGAVITLESEGNQIRITDNDTLESLGYDVNLGVKRYNVYVKAADDEVLNDDFDDYRSVVNNVINFIKNNNGFREQYDPNGIYAEEHQRALERQEAESTGENINPKVDEKTGEDNILTEEQEAETAAETQTEETQDNRPNRPNRPNREDGQEAETATKARDIYSDIEFNLNIVKEFNHEGIRFTMIQEGDQWRGTISRYPGDSMISNARDFAVMYRTDHLGSRAEIASELVEVARNNKFFDRNADTGEQEQGTAEEATAENAPVETNADTETAEEETAAEAPVQAAQEEAAKTAPSVSNENFTIAEGTRNGYIEIKFSKEPMQSVKDLLKQFGMRYTSKYGHWYGKANAEQQADLVDQLNAIYAYEGEEETENAEISGQGVREQTSREDNGGTVREYEPDREGTPRLDAEGAEGSVQSDGGRGETSEVSDGGGQQTGRHDLQSDTERDGSRRSPGSSESTDQGDRLTEEAAQEEAKAEEEHQAQEQQEVEDHIRQQESVSPKGDNFIIGEDFQLGETEKAKFRNNITALQTLAKLNAEGRQATREEQQELAQYVGWGGLSKAFGRYNARLGTWEAEIGWGNEFDSLRGLVDSGVITEAEFRSMSKSTMNANYTSFEVVRAMYDGLMTLGFNGGRMLEPSCGVGNFVGAMPANVRSSVKGFTMVELDRVTAQIAKQLYPNFDVRNQGFQDSMLADGYFDVAIGNVPFGEATDIHDNRYPQEVQRGLHNYFFAKSFDKVRTGGIVMYITSAHTMDAYGKDSIRMRNYFSDKADLLGAIRLPNTAFKSNAGTQVTTDILIFKKRAENTPYSGEKFSETGIVEYTGKYYLESRHVNEYFNHHPEMVLGELVSGGVRGEEGTYNPLNDGRTLSQQIHDAFANIHGRMDYNTKTSTDVSRKASAKEEAPAYGYRRSETGDGYQQYVDGVWRDIDTSTKSGKILVGGLRIWDAYTNLVNRIRSGNTADEIAAARKNLNDIYDEFVKKYGYLNDQANKNALKDHPNRYNLLALEEGYSKPVGKKSTAQKSGIFTRDTIKADKTVDHVNSIEDGVVVSVNIKGSVDTAYIAKISGKTEEEVTRIIIDNGLAFKQMDGSLQAPDVYLSGNVRQKLKDAEALAMNDPDFQHNVDALRAVVPADVKQEDIYVKPGTTWVPASVYEEFIRYMVGSNRYGKAKVNKVEYNEYSGQFTIEWNPLFTNKWCTNERPFIKLLDAVMNNRDIKVTAKDPDGHYYVLKKETQAAIEMADKISNEFRRWIFTDCSQRDNLLRLYNDTFRSTATPSYDGSNLTFNGLNANFSLRSHQLNAVQRIISSGGNTLLAHKVGAGKTLEMAAAAMKLKELGIVKKPMFVVPKSLVAQWGREFRDYFPSANILVAADNSFQTGKRKQFINQIAMNDYDAVIVSYEQFGKIPMSQKYAEEFYNNQINLLMRARSEGKDSKKGMTVKEYEKALASIQAKLDGITKMIKDWGNSTFDELGVDSIFVDEAHNYKNLMYVSNMKNVNGLGTRNGSKRSFDMLSKVQYLQKLNGGRGVVFATATPIMNSMAEMYTMQRYLQGPQLEKAGLSTFDAWANQFGKITSEVEVGPTGQGARISKKFANFANLPEMQAMFRQFADVLTDVPGLKIPKMRGGKINTVVCEASPFQEQFMQNLTARANNIKNVDPKEDNMLKITSDGRKIAYSQHAVDSSLPYEPGCKIFKCCDNVIDEYKKSTGITVTELDGTQTTINGTQIIFADMFTPKASSKKDSKKTEEEDSEETEGSEDTEASFENAMSLYEDMRAYLVERGIPASEIAFIHEAKNQAQRLSLFADMNSGKVRVLIGSTGKMGVGMNAQRCVTAIHHLDSPWRPGDIEQRDGRAFRQKNLNSEVAKYVYTTKGSFDTRLWDLLDSKNKMINQAMNGASIGREVEDVGNVTLSASEVKAVTSNDPRLFTMVRLQAELEKLNSVYEDFIKTKQKAASDVQTYTNSAQVFTDDASAIQKMADVFRKSGFSKDNFVVTIGGKEYKDAQEAAKAMAESVSKILTGSPAEKIGEISGIAIYASKKIENGDVKTTIRLSMPGVTLKSNFADKFTSFGFGKNQGARNINRIFETAEGLKTSADSLIERAQDQSNKASEAKKISESEFEELGRLNQVRSELNSLKAELIGKDEQVMYGDEEEQYNDRYSLSDDDLVSYSERITDEELLNYLNDQVERGEVTKVYRAMQVQPVDENGNVIKASVQRVVSTNPLMVEAKTFGKNAKTAVYPAQLYSPMAGIVNGKWSKNIELNAWEQTTYDLEHATYEIDKKTGQPKIDTDRKNASYGEIAYSYGLVKGGIDDNGKALTNIPARYNPYIHTSKTALNDQFSSANIRPELVTVECLIPNSELTSGFRAEGAKDRVGLMHWHSGPTSSRLAQVNKAREVILTRYDMPIRVLQDSEVAQSIADYIGNTPNVAIPESTVTPSLAAALKEQGISVLNKEDWAKYAEEYPTKTFAKKANESSGVQYQQRSATFSDIDILEMAADNLDTDKYSQEEFASLTAFREGLQDIKDKKTERRDWGIQYRNYQFGANNTTVDRAKAEDARQQMKRLDAEIQKMEEDLLNVERRSVLKDVLQDARKVIEQIDYEKAESKIRSYRARLKENAEAKHARETIVKHANEMIKWLAHPGNKDVTKHIPDVIKSSVLPFLESINMSSEKMLSGNGVTKADARYLDNLRLVRDMVKNAQDAGEAYDGYMDLPTDFMDKIERQISTIESLAKQDTDEHILNMMNAQELKDLSKIVLNLEHLVKNFNSFLSNQMYKHVYEAGEASIEAMKAMAAHKEKTELGQGIDNFLYWKQMRPAYGFERFGEGGKAIYDGFRLGQAKLARNATQIIEFTNGTDDKAGAYTTEEVKDWEKQEIEATLEDGSTIRMKASMAMSLYLLMKREQARNHILKGGARIATFVGTDKNVNSDTGHAITLEDVAAITDQLSDRQKEVADNLQHYMATVGSKWGNYVSMKRFGEKMFDDPNYFPINSDGRHLNAEASAKPDNASLYALLNTSFTKEVVAKANNRIMLFSVFDVFSNHMSQMAQYNAFALPVLDSIKWFNYKTDDSVIENVLDDNGEQKFHVRGKHKGEPVTKTVHTGIYDSVRDQMDRVYGTPAESRPGSGKMGYAQQFVIGIIKAFNGTESQGGEYDSMGLNALRTYNIAQIAFNLRVVAQQPMAITRAAMIINPGYLTKAASQVWFNMKNLNEEMKEYSGIAAWKELGFYDTNISRGVSSLIKHDERFRDKLAETGLYLAGKADSVTWTTMWLAAKMQAEAETGDPIDTDECRKAAAKIFEETIYKTQVVDSVLTKNEFLRSKDFFARSLGSFMSEPTTTASMVLNEIEQFNRDAAALGKGAAFMMHKGKIAKLASVYAVGAIVLAAVQGVMDAYRDDDDDKWWEKFADHFRDNFIDELLPFNKLPLVSDVYDLAKQILSEVGVDTYGNAANSVWMQWTEPLVKAVGTASDKAGGKAKGYTWYYVGYKLLQAASGLTGLPMASATREIVSFWNNTFGLIDPNLKVRTYEASSHKAIREAASAAGISQDVYEPFVDFMAEVKSIDSDGDSKTDITKKDQVIEYIDSMKISANQKDALYMAAGYKESTLAKTPWH